MTRTVNEKTFWWGVIVGAGIGLCVSIYCHKLMGVFACAGILFIALSQLMDGDA